MKKFYLLAILLITVVVVLAVVLDKDTKAPATYKQPRAVNTTCGPYREDKVVTIGSAEIKAEGVKTPGAREKGLGGRPCIEPDRGMLFVFDRPGRYPFWMKGMKFPIDIVWIAPNHKVVGLDIAVKPSTYPDSFVSKKPVRYVLELKADRTKELKVNLGTTVNF